MTGLGDFFTPPFRRDVYAIRPVLDKNVAETCRTAACPRHPRIQRKPTNEPGMLMKTKDGSAQQIANWKTSGLARRWFFALSTQNLGQNASFLGRDLLHSRSPRPPWGRGWTAAALSSANAGRVRGCSGPQRHSFPLSSHVAQSPGVPLRSAGIAAQSTQVLTLGEGKTPHPSRSG